ncbi:alpha-amylase family glycosyl hydrolase, partial [Paenibacillus tuaregi]|uniref:alpha-amylase family glycosyl hydrolase n=1 Tax=Paenibacillus tuaregi TaxID=1816681 RepID=UPI0011DE2E20
PAAPAASEAPAAKGELQPDVLVDQPGAKSKWVVAGSFQGWNNTSSATQLKHLVGDFYEYSTVLEAGHYEFKIVKSGTWKGFANDNDSNFSFDLAEAAKINFYVNEALNQARINIPGVQGIQQYTPKYTEANWPRLTGDIQKLFQEKEWSPEEARQMFVDTHFDGSVFELQRTLPVGRYEMKVVLGNTWENTPSYGNSTGGNFVLQTIDPADVTFSIDLSKEMKELTSNYLPSDSQWDGKIDKGKLAFDSRLVTYKKPFGAIKEESEDLTLRIAAAAGDVQLARAELTNPQGVASAYDMHTSTSVGGLDYWEVTIPKSAFKGIGVWNYKFILIDGAAKVEYGDDNARGGTGTTADEGVVPYDLTVYKKDFTTPDWMKNAVVYQLFPDRFFDGDQSNNRAKIVDGYRGGEALPGETLTTKNGHKLQFFDGGVPDDPAPEQVAGKWPHVPENPDRTKPENKPYFPNATTDGIWTNEFYGGDIQGVGQKLDYLKSLGVTVIYFNPVAWAASNHKYDATDYKHLDPMFGEPVYNTPGDPASGLDYEKTRVASDRVFTEFAKQARAKGIKLIVDGVFNHVGDDSIYFDRYEKYPEIGAYEYWSKVYDRMNAGKTQTAAEQEVIDSFTSQINPATGKNYVYPDDFDFTHWFKVTNEKVDGHYKYEGWWGYDSLPVIDAPEAAAGDADGLAGNHEWNVQGYRDQVIGHDLTGMSDTEAASKMQYANSQRWEWLGARGWRLDVAPDVSAGTWEKFRQAVKSTGGRSDANGERIDDPIILGEEWGVATKFLLGDQFDSVMNYRFRGAVQSFIMNGNAQQFNDALESIREDYPREAWEVMLNLVDSHDTIRSITKYDKPNWEEEHLEIAPPPTDQAIQKQALTAIFQMGYPGAPTIYYGDEVGLEGTKDPDSRRTFPWERVMGSDGQYSGTGRYESLFNTYKQAAEVRNTNEVFRTGDLKVVYNKGDVIAYARKTDSTAGLVVINRGSSDASIAADVTGYLPDGVSLTDQLGSKAAAAVVQGKISLTVKAMSGMMMTSDSDLTNVPVVSNLKAAPGNGLVTLTWDAVPGAAEYRVYRAPLEGGELEVVGSVTDSSWTDTKVNNGTKYYYTVTAKTSSGESSLSDYVSATPFFPVQSVEISQQSNSVVLGAGNKTSEIQVTLDIPGLTDNMSFTGKEAPGLIAKLAYYKEGTSKDNASEVKLRYKSDTSDGKKVYWAVFEPTEAGTYYYFARISTDNGQKYTDSASSYVDVQADENDTTAPAAPELSPIQVESSRVQLSWTEEDDTVYQYEIYRNAGGAEYKKIATVDKTAKSYVDLTVSNDTAYTYKVAAVDSSYNRAYSNEQAVTPKLVMVDVKLRVHLPGYTPATDDIYIAGDFNGWNQAGGKLNVPSGATTRDVVEYSFKMMAGKSLQYKYTRGTWATEALTSHNRKANDTEDYSNYAYSSTDTNMKLTVKNEGSNQMVVDDYILRWVDMPMIVTMPRISYGDNITYETTDNKFTLKANVPYGVKFTINDQPLPPGAMDAQGNVELKDIPINPGSNKYTLHIEPSAETLNLPWYEDKGRASQATKSLELSITRKDAGGNPDPVAVTGVKLDQSRLTLTAGGATGRLKATVEPEGASDKTVAFTSSDETIAKVDANGVVTPLRPGTATITVTTKDGSHQASCVVTVTSAGHGGNNGSEGSSNNTNSGNNSNPGSSKDTDNKSVSVTEQQLKDALNRSITSGSRVVKIEAGCSTRILLPVDAASLLGDKPLEVALGSDSIVIPSKVLSQLVQQASTAGTAGTAGTATAAAGAQIQLQAEPLSDQAAQALVSKADSSQTKLKAASRIYDYRLLLINSSGKAIAELNRFDVPLQLTFKVAANANKNNIGVYYLPDKGQVEYIGGKLKGDTLTAEIHHFSKYAVLEMNKSFTDLPAGHWAEKAVQSLTAKHIIKGTSESAYEPDRSITRGEFAALIVRALELKAVHPAGFTDISVNDWYASSIAAANEAGIVQGRTASRFEPNAVITREEMAVVLVRAYDVLNKTKASQASELAYTDAKDISSWAVDSIKTASGLGLLNGQGNNRFMPKGKTTRAESAQVIYKLLSSQK